MAEEGLKRRRRKETSIIDWEKVIGESLDEIYSRPAHSGCPSLPDTKKRIQKGKLKPFHLALWEQLESYADDDLRGQEGGRKLTVGRRRGVLKNELPGLGGDEEKKKLCNSRGQSSSTSQSDHHRLICESCGTLCDTMAKLRRHIQCHSLSQLRCTFCSKKFKRKQDMDRHVERMHKRSYRFACTTCPKRFADSSGLRRHQRFHLGIKPHLCSKCGRQFTCFPNLRSHMKTRHSGNFQGVKPIVPIYQMTTTRKSRSR